MEPNKVQNANSTSTGSSGFSLPPNITTVNSPPVSGAIIRKPLPPSQVPVNAASTVSGSSGFGNPVLQPSPLPDFNKTQQNYQNTIQASGTDVSDASEVRMAIASANANNAQIASGFPDATGTGTGNGLYPAPDVSNPQSVGVAKEIQAGIDEMKRIGQEWISYLDAEQGLQEQFKTLMGSTNGPTGQSANALSQELLGIKGVMRMTEDDIRSELSAGGGLATESQVMALTGARNKVLELKAANILDALNLQTGYVENMMKYAGEDRKSAEAKFEAAFSINEKLTSWMKDVEDSGFNKTIQYQQLMGQQADRAWRSLETIARGSKEISDEQARTFTTLFNEAGFPVTNDQLKGFVQNEFNLQQAEATYKYLRNLAEKADLDTGDGAGGFKFTDTQINRGAAAAGLERSAFTSLDPQVQNFFVSQTGDAEDYMAMISGLPSGVITRKEAEETFSLLPEAVRSYFMGFIGDAEKEEAEKAEENKGKSLFDRIRVKNPFK